MGLNKEKDLEQQTWLKYSQFAGFKHLAVFEKKR
jgi:hypothetical protein